MHQDHQRTGGHAAWPGQRSRQRPVAGAYRDRLLGELALVDIGRIRRVGRFFGGVQKESFDLTLGVKANQGIERHGLVVAANLNPGRATDPVGSSRSHLLDRPELLPQLLPELLKFRGAKNLLHLGVKVRRGLREPPRLAQVEKLPRLLFLVGLAEEGQNQGY